MDRLKLICIVLIVIGCRSSQRRFENVNINQLYFSKTQLIILSVNEQDVYPSKEIRVYDQKKHRFLMKYELDQTYKYWLDSARDHEVFLSRLIFVQTLDKKVGAKKETIKSEGFTFHFDDVLVTGSGYEKPLIVQFKTRKNNNLVFIDSSRNELELNLKDILIDNTNLFFRKIIDNEISIFQISPDDSANYINLLKTVRTN